MASEGTVEWRKIVKKSAKHERRQAERAEAGEDERGSEEGEDPLTLAVEETLRVHASVSKPPHDSSFSYADVAIEPLERCRRKTRSSTASKAPLPDYRYCLRLPAILVAYPSSMSMVLPP